MTRQEKLKEIGNMHVSAYASKFIIPVPHRFYDNGARVFESIKESGWSIENETDTMKLNAFNIKPYIYGNMIPRFDEKDKQSFLATSQTLLLKKETNDFKIILKDLKGAEYKLILKDLDLWIFEENISFFVLSIDLDDSSEYMINQINYVNSILRSFKFLEITKEKNYILAEQTKMIDGEKDSFLEYVLELTHIKNKNKSFLNIRANECTQKYCEKKDTHNLYSIYNSSSNAKLILGMQTSTTTYSDGTEIEKCDEQSITFIDAGEMSILREIPYYLATCSSFDPDKSFMSDNGYIYQLIDKGGFNIWKYSSGLTIYDSSAFIGLGDDGGPVVGNVNGSFYFIYMLNLYIKFQTTYIAHTIIDKHFESIKISYWYRKFQKLKNQFVSDDIGIKFQENELNNSMSTALKTDELLSEVSSNIVETKSITERNLAIYITWLGLIIIYIFEDEIKNCYSGDDKLFALFVVVVLGYIVYKLRHKIRKIFKF